MGRIPNDDGFSSARFWGPDFQTKQDQHDVEKKIAIPYRFEKSCK